MTTSHVPIELLDSTGALLTTAIAKFSRSQVPTVGWVGALTPKGPTAKGPEAKAFNSVFLKTQGLVTIRFPGGQTVEAEKVHNLSRRRVVVRVHDRYGPIMESIR